MVRDRVSLFCGMIVALVCALVLIFAGTRLLDVVMLPGKADPGLHNDLNIARLFAVGLGIGLALVIYALAAARPRRLISLPGKLGIVVAGLLIVLAAAAICSELQGAVGSLDELEEMRHLIVGFDALANELKQIHDDQVVGLAGGFALLLAAVLLLAFSAWNLFWSHTLPRQTDRYTRPAALVGVAAIVLWVSLAAAATLIGGAAVDAGQPLDTPTFDLVLREVKLSLLLSRCSTIGLSLFGMMLTTLGILFRVERTD